MEEEIVGTLEEVFVSDEEEVNDLTPTDIIEEPDDDPSIPTEDQDRGEAVDPTAAEIVINGEVVEPDEEDVINDDTVEDLTEPEIAVDEEPVEPIISNTETLPTIGNVKAEDRVMIALVNGEATVLGTVGSGDRQEQDIVRIEADVADLGEVVADKASIADLSAATGRITTLEATKADVSDLNAATGRITTLETNKANISDLNAATGRITNLETNALTATSAVITDLQTNKVSTSDLQANYITANQIAAYYAKVDASNMNTATIRDAWITALMVQSGLLAHSGTIYTLDAIQLNADRITAGTIDVQRLIVTVSGHKYLVQFDAQGNPTYVKLDGDTIQDSTITADKLVANTITTNQITTNNLVGTGGWINLHNGTFQYTNATSGEGISWDGTHLNINANSIYVGTTNVVTAIAAADEIATLVREYSNGVLVCKTNQTVGALVNSNGTFDVVSVTWSNGVPTAGDSYASYGSVCVIGQENNNRLIVDFHTLAMVDNNDDAYFKVEDKRNSYGETTITETVYYWVLNGDTSKVNWPTTTVTPQIALTYKIDEIESMSINGVDVSDLSGCTISNTTNRTTGSMVAQVIGLDVSYDDLATDTLPDGTVMVDGDPTLVIEEHGSAKNLRKSYTMQPGGRITLDAQTLSTYSQTPAWPKQIIFNEVVVTYISSDKELQTLTFGSRSEEQQYTNFGNGSATFGKNNVATGENSFAFGVGSKALANNAFVEGYQSTANARYTHAEGEETTASGIGSHAEGYKTEANGTNAHAEGKLSVADGDYSHAEGYATHAEGAHSHAEGELTKATSGGAHAEGVGCEASGVMSHAEGWASKATGGMSHSEGYWAEASGSTAHAEGAWTKATGNYSHAQNYWTTAGYANQTAIGKHNNNKSTSLFEVGNGSTTTPSNALEVNANGNTTIGGKLYCYGGTAFESMFSCTSVSQTIGSVASGSTKTLTFDVSRTGYRAIAVSGWYMNGAAGLYPYMLRLNGTNVQAYVRNPTGSASSASAKIEVQVLYVKNTA